MMRSDRQDDNKNEALKKKEDRNPKNVEDKVHSMKLPSFTRTHLGRTSLGNS